MSHEDLGKSLSSREPSRGRGPEAVFETLQAGSMDRAEGAEAGGANLRNGQGQTVWGLNRTLAGALSGCEPWQGFEQRRDGV